MADERKPHIPLVDIPVPRDAADAIDILEIVLLWLDANGHMLAAIEVNDAIERLANPSG